MAKIKSFLKIWWSLKNLANKEKNKQNKLIHNNNRKGWPPQYIIQPLSYADLFFFFFFLAEFQKRKKVLRFVLNYSIFCVGNHNISKHRRSWRGGTSQRWPGVGTVLSYRSLRNVLFVFLLCGSPCLGVATSFGDGTRRRSRRSTRNNKVEY